MNTDPPYNVKVEPRSNNAIAAGNSSFAHSKKQMHHQKLDLARHPEKSKPTNKKLRAKDRPLANDFVSDAEFDRLLDAWFGNAARVLQPGRGFYIWGGYANCGNYPPFLKKHQLYFSQAIIWDKQHPVLTRKDYMGAHEWCQPADTQVQTPDGSVAICSLRDGDRVVSYDPSYQRIVGPKTGFEIRATSMPYSGNLLGVTAGNRTTWCTPGHIWNAKLSPEADKHWCVYLMRKGDWWRVGKSMLLSTWGFGIKQRLYTEGGDEAWILSTHASSVEAAIVEQVTLAEYGIPLITWSESHSARRTIADVAGLYERLDLNRLRVNALRLLADRGRDIEHPCVRSTRTHEKISRRVPFLVRACNLIPGLMSVPVSVGGNKTAWVPIRAIDPQPFDGPVYSMDVSQFGHYVADGIVTHNCFYGWKEGAAHKFYGPNNAQDLWHIKKIPPQQMQHLTAKPAELAVRAMQYSSVAGENVLDLFGGSGSTLIAAQQTGRKAFLMELDPLYCDVIVDRYQRFTGQPAILNRTGESPIPMKPRGEHAMKYLASPYSHPDPAIRQQRFEAAVAAVAVLMRAGHRVFSPVVHGHPLTQHGLPSDWTFWERHARWHLERCDEVVVLMLDGWAESDGVLAEIDIAARVGKSRLVPLSGPPDDAHVGPRGRGGGPVVVWDANEKTPQRRGRGASWAANGRLRQCEVAAFGLLEPGLLPLRVDLPQDGRVERGRGRLAAGARSSTSSRPSPRSFPWSSSVPSIRRGPWPPRRGSSSCRRSSFSPSRASLPWSPWPWFRSSWTWSPSFVSLWLRVLKSASRRPPAKPADFR